MKFSERPHYGRMAMQRELIARSPGLKAVLRARQNIYHFWQGPWRAPKVRLASGETNGNQLITRSVINLIMRGQSLRAEVYVHGRAFEQTSARPTTSRMKTIHA